ncbi:MAG: protein kinase [Planctomycetia bacterium]|nr:protein kinase [Planctomycetia bacterium]
MGIESDEFSGAPGEAHSVEAPRQKPLVLQPSREAPAVEEDIEQARRQGNADGVTLIGSQSEPAADTQFAATLLSGAPPEMSGEDVSRLAPCQSFGDYEIIAEIARGGMGVVYRARQKGLNRIVALKVILAGSHAGREDLERFRTEAETIARLQHPNIVQIHDVGEHDGLPYLSLEYCAGGSLARKLEGTPLPPQDASALISTLARAMHAAHQASVVHRDLKPANVLFAADGTPKITDFGLAKKLDDQGQTHTGTIMGTPSYMAPEQAAGKHHTIGPAADVYALGAVLYECLTGRPPFKAATPLETVMQVLHDEPVAPLKIQPRTPRDIDTICMKCLHKDPLRRYASAAELADDLTRYLNDEPVLARPVGRIERTARWCRRNPARAISAVLGLLVLAGAIVVPIVLAIRESQNAASLASAQQKTQSALDESRAATRRAQDAELEKTEKLWQSYLDRARAGRASRILGQRFDSLQALREAALIRPDRKLRDEAIASLALVDLRPAGQGAVFTPLDRPFNAAVGTLTAVDPISGRVARQKRNLVIVESSPGNQILELAHPRAPNIVQWSPDGRMLAVACDDRAVYLWKIPEGRLQSSLEGLHSGLMGMDFRPDGSMLATHGYDATTRLWDPVSGQVLLRSLSVFIPGPFSRDGKFLHNNGQLQEVADGAECRVLHHGEPGNRGRNADSISGPWEVEFSGDDRTVAAWGADGPRLWDAEFGRELAFFTRRPLTEGGGSFIGANRLGFSGSSGVTVRELVMSPEHPGRIVLGEPKRIWPEVGPGFVSARTGAVPPTIPESARRMRASADGRWVVFALPVSNRAIAVRTDEPRNVRVLDGQVTCQYVAISPDGAWVATGSWSWSPPVPVKIWDTSSGKMVHEIKDNPFGTLQFTPDGKWLVIGSQTEYRFWKVGTWELDRQFKRASNLPGPAAFSPDGRLMAMCPSNLVVRLVDPRNGDEIATLTPPEPKLISEMSFSHNGDRLAVATENNSLYLWDLRAIREELRRMNLDWDPPLEPPASARPTTPLRARGIDLVTPVLTDEELLSEAAIGDNLSEDEQRRLVLLRSKPN